MSGITDYRVRPTSDIALQARGSLSLDGYAAYCSGGGWSSGRLAAPATPQVGAWSTSGPSSPVVDEPQPLVISSCGLTPKLAVTCVLTLSSSHRFTSYSALMCPRCALTSAPGWAHGSAGRLCKLANYAICLPGLDRSSTRRPGSFRIYFGSWELHRSLPALCRGWSAPDPGRPDPGRHNLVHVRSAS